MAEGLATADGTVLDVPAAGHEPGEREFAAAMAKPEPGNEMPAPPMLADPEAPYGRTLDGKPKKGPGGRPSTKNKADKPRTQTVASVATDGTAQTTDYTKPLAELTEGVWYLCAQFPATQAQAAILKAHRPSLVSGWSLAAQNNRMIASGVEMLTGKATWVAAVAMASAPFVMQSLAIWTKSDEDLAKAGMPTHEELAASTVKELQELARLQEEELRMATAAA